MVAADLHGERLSRRGWRRVLSLVLFFAILICGAWPSPRKAHIFSALYCPIANALIGGHTFGTIGHARLLPAQDMERQTGDSVTADTVLLLTADGFRGEFPLGISLRRDVFLPLLIAAALILVAPLPVAHRLKCLAIAVPTTLAAGVGANAILAAWTFSNQMKGVYPSSTAWAQTTNFLQSILLLPPGNRFIAPLLLGAMLILWQWPRCSTHPTVATGRDPGSS